VDGAFNLIAIDGELELDEPWFDDEPIDEEEREDELP
jgi:hypothetical protein